MCRHLAYLGPPRTLASVLLEPAHGLLEQAYAPTDMRGGGTINVDGFGAGWYPAVPVPAGAGGNGHAVVDPGAPPEAVREGVHDAAGHAGHAGHDGAGHGAAGHGAAGHGGPAPVRVRSDQPIWSDTSFAAVAASTPATGVLGAVRAASPGMPVVSTAAAPFAEGRWLFSLNGMVRDWPGSLTGLASTLPTLDLITLDAPTDAALLWALVRSRLRAGHDPAAILADTVLATEDAAPGSRLNLLLTDGTTIWGTAWRHTLAVHTDADSVTVASEPTDPLPAWTQVPDRHLVVARPGHHDLHPLTEHVTIARPRGDSAGPGCDRQGAR